MTLIVDFTHVHRKTTGIERVSLDLFGPEQMAGIDALHVRATSSRTMVLAQWMRMPLRAASHRRDLFLCPGFPPSLPLSLLAGERLITYIHDLFLIERPHDLNRTARFYMRPSFRFAVRHGRHFLVNSRFTESRLRAYCSPQASVMLLRPPVGDAFDLASLAPRPAPGADVPLRLVSIGTIEPRKNFLYGAEIRARLEALLNRPVEFHIIGRSGWGTDTQALSRKARVVLHGYCTPERAQAILAGADIFLSTSREEGLGLPLLEVQHGGLCVAATDIPAFREVLGTSGLLLPLDDAARAAGILCERLSSPDWKPLAAAAARANIAAWNAGADGDRNAFLSRLQSRI